MHYSVQPRDRIFIKSYGFLVVTKNMGENISTNIRKNVKWISWIIHQTIHITLERKSGWNKWWLTRNI